MLPLGLPGLVVIFALLLFVVVIFVVLFLVLLFFAQLVINGEIGLVGQAAFLISRPLLKVFVHVRLGKHVFCLRDTQPGDAPDGSQVDNAIMQRAGRSGNLPDKQAAAEDLHPRPPRGARLLLERYTARRCA